MVQIEFKRATRKNEAMTWLQETSGPPGFDTWAVIESRYRGLCFYVVDEDVALMFRLVFAEEIDRAKI